VLRIPLWLSALLAVVAALAAALAARFLLIEPPQFAWTCQSIEPPWWCPLRTGGIVFLRAGGLGLLALMAGAFALWRGQRRAARRAALLALGAGAAGLVLYGPEAAAGGALLGALAVVRG
jgi:hypothetical protein